MPENYDPPLPWTGEVDAPLTLFQSHVRDEWIDEFKHVNNAHYVTIGDHANWAFWNWLNHPAGTAEARDGHEYVIVESHVNYLGELAVDTPIHVTTQLIGVDDKRYVLFHEIWDSTDESLVATNEVKCLGFNLQERRPEAWSTTVSERLRLVLDAHAGLWRPAKAGAGISLERR